MIGHRSSLPLVSSMSAQLVLVFNSVPAFLSFVVLKVVAHSSGYCIVAAVAEKDRLILFRDLITFHFVATL